MIPQIISLQWFQEMHDAKYHRDVCTMPRMQRLTHLHQHLVKYSASELKRTETYPKALACLLSMANTLNVDIATAVTGLQGSLVKNFTQMKPRYAPEILEDAQQELLGSMAKVLEARDHDESIAYKTDMSQYVAKYLVILLQNYNKDDLGCLNALINQYINTLCEIKKANVFYPFYHTEDCKNETYYSLMMYNRASVVS